MTTSDREERKNLILAHEREMARQLAHHVIEKPTPRVWMIFIPVFFVFYFWKLKEYENGLKDFAEKHLIPRSRILEATFEAEEKGRQVDIDLMVGVVVGPEGKSRDICEEWLTVLVGHYRLLLSARGEDYPALVRSGYRSKSNYLLFCRQLARTETAFNMSLLPSIDAESAVLRQVTQSMAEGMDILLHREADSIFT